jgi:hypothetical protein
LALSAIPPRCHDQKVSTRCAAALKVAA